MSTARNQNAGSGNPPSFSFAGGRDLHPKNLEKILKTYHRNYKDYLPPKNRLIVDLGCSEGLFLEYLARRGFTNVIGVDSDPDALKVCRERLKGYNERRIEILQENIGSFLQSKENGSVTCIVMNDVIEHFAKEELIVILRDVWRVLEVDGVFIAKTGNIENPLNIGIYLRDFTHKIAFTRDSLRQCLIISGFNKDRIEIKPIRNSIDNPIELLASLFAFGISALLKLTARIMRMHIYETSKLIYVLARR